jgi:hypothetical protein
VPGRISQATVTCWKLSKASARKQGREWARSSASEGII